MSYIGNEPIISATRTITEVVATAGQTTFYPNGGYTVGYLDVIVNGAQLQTSDFTAINGSSVVLNVACVVGDDVRMVAYGTFSVGNTATVNRTTFALWENAKTIGQSYSITSGNNAVSAGPITIASGATFTIPSGSRWAIV